MWATKVFYLHVALNLGKKPKKGMAFRACGIMQPGAKTEADSTQTI